MTAPLLSVRDLSTGFRSGRRFLPAVDRVSFEVAAGEVLGVVGESGSGKSVMAQSILRLIPDPPGKILGGEVLFGGRDLLRMAPRELRKVRGGGIGMIFQEPMSALNPVKTIGEQIHEAIRLHLGLGRAAAVERSVDLLARVGIPAPRRRIEDYPHQLSGGMRQRVMIAMALAPEPRLLIADEPTTALDVTIQAQILELLRRLQREDGMGLILITHDLGVIAQIADRVMVMYCGRAVEIAAIGELFAAPLHPYTRGLLNCAPRLDVRLDDLPSIPGMVPPLNELPRGCRFRARCDRAFARCADEDPMLAGASGRKVACFAADRELAS
jgi:oligopeptide/dipeptide ABC transporter ATP-binding protein